MIKLALLFISFVCQASESVPLIPNDSLFDRQWSLYNDGKHSVIIRHDEFHRIPQLGKEGVDIGWLKAQDLIAQKAKSQVVVAVIDSGLDYTHPDLVNRIAPGGWDFLSNGDKVSDLIGHGTHVSGIIAANTGNGLGVAGIAPETVKVLPLRVLSESFVNMVFNGKPISEYAAEAIRYAVSHGAKIINMSFGWPQMVDTQNVRNAVKEAIQSGVLIVASAGNDRKNNPTYPCSYEGVLCVGSLTNTGEMAFYSNVGGVVDLVAPGDGIVSTFSTTKESGHLRIHGYEILGGTSQAAPEISAIAAIIRSAFPEISLDELKARILLSTSQVAEKSSSLYGFPNITKCLEQKPQTVYLPSFKEQSEFVIDPNTLEISGQVQLKNLWVEASDVRASILIQDIEVGKKETSTLNTGQSVSIPWKYKFNSLDDASKFNIALKVTDSSGKTLLFNVQLTGVRALGKLEPIKRINVSDKGAWVGFNGRNYFSTMAIGDSYPKKAGLPFFYQVVKADNNGSVVEVFDPTNQNPLGTITVPDVQRVQQVIQIDADGDGQLDWLFTGIVAKQNSALFQFYFLNSKFESLWGKSAPSIWQVPLDNRYGNLIVRDYANGSFWIRENGRVIPGFIARSVLPDIDNYKALDRRRGQSANHFLYLMPKNVSEGNILNLQLRGLDSMSFRDGLRMKYPELYLRGFVPPSVEDMKNGRLNLLFMAGRDLEAQILLMQLSKTDDYKLIIHRELNPLTVNKSPSVSYGENFNHNGIAFFDIDEDSGSVTWVDSTGNPIDYSEFSFHDTGNPVLGLIKSYRFNSGEKFVFLESNFDLIGIHQGKMAVSPIERDSSFPYQMFSEMFTSVLVGTSIHPEPGIFVDSTLVRGNQLSIAVWNSTKEVLEKPLKYSLQMPSQCVQMNPIQLRADEPSFALPLLCRHDKDVELRVYGGLN